MSITTYLTLPLWYNKLMPTCFPTLEADRIVFFRDGLKCILGFDLYLSVDLKGCPRSLEFSHRMHGFTNFNAKLLSQKKIPYAQIVFQNGIHWSIWYSNNISMDSNCLLTISESKFNDLTDLMTCCSSVYVMIGRPVRPSGVFNAFSTLLDNCIPFICSGICYFCNILNVTDT